MFALGAGVPCPPAACAITHAAIVPAKITRAPIAQNIRFNIFKPSKGNRCFTTFRAAADNNRLCYNRPSARAPVSKLRISIVQYLNTAPLVRGFTHGPLQGKYELSFTVPSRCAEALRAGAVDVAIIPAIEYQRIDNLAVLPNLAIASKKSVRSLLLVSKKPIEEVTRIALDRSSRSTQVLVCILCAKRWGIAPECFEADPELPAMLEGADAALLIGDPALRLALNAESRGNRDAGGKITCSGGIAGLPNDAPV